MVTICTLCLDEGKGKIDKGHRPGCFGAFEKYPEGDCPTCLIKEFCKETNDLRIKGEVSAEELNNWLGRHFEVFGRHPSIWEFSSAFQAGVD